MIVIMVFVENIVIIMITIVQGLGVGVQHLGSLGLDPFGSFWPNAMTSLTINLAVGISQMRLDLKASSAQH